MELNAIILQQMFSDKLLMIVTLLFVLSMISERVGNFLKLHLPENGILLPIINFQLLNARNYKIKQADKEEEKIRERNILTLALFSGFITSVAIKANLIEILQSENCTTCLGWNDSSINFAGKWCIFAEPFWDEVWDLIKVLIGCLMTAFFISVGSKFWHDLLDLLLNAKNLKEKLGRKETYQFDKVEQLDEWLQVNQGDMVRKVFEDNKAALKNLKNVISVGIGYDKNEKYVEVVINDNDSHLIPKTLPYPLPDGTIKPIPVKVIPSSTITTQLAISDDITNNTKADKYGSFGLGVKFKNQQEQMLLTCYHVVIGKEQNFDHFSITQPEEVIHPHGVNGSKIGEVKFGIRTDQIDIALIDKLSEKISNKTPKGDLIKNVRDISYEERYSEIEVKFFGFNTKPVAKTGVIRSLYNSATIEYILPNGQKENWELNNLIAISDEKYNAISSPGDSGSALLDNQNNVIGIVVAGNKNTTYAIPIQPIFSQLNIQLI